MVNPKQITIITFTTLAAYLVSINSNVSFEKLKSLETISAAVSLTPQVAKADVTDSLTQIIRDNWSSITGAIWSPYNRQVFVVNLGPNEVNQIKNQYRERADGVLKNRAVEKFLSQYRIEGWRANTFRYALYWKFDGRVENGYYNLFLRMSNDVADKFQRARGW